MSAEQAVEKSAIRMHTPHPKQMAQDEAKIIMRGVKSSEAEIGDDLSVFNDGMKGAEAAAKAKGGGEVPGLGKNTEKDLKQGIGMYNEASRIKQAMETYAPSLLQLAADKPDPEVIKNSRQDSKALGHPNMAAKYVAMIEGDAPAPVKAKKVAAPVATAKSAPQKKDGNGDDTEAGRDRKASSEGGHYSPAAPKKVKAEKYIKEVMARVDGTVDMQFAPLEEQLGYNLHQEVKLAKHEADSERSRSASDTEVTEKQKDFREANAIDVAAKNAEEEALAMKAAVNKAKSEHANMGPAEEALSLLQLGEAQGPAPALHGEAKLMPEVQKKAIGMMIHNNKIDQVLMKAMRKAEQTINTELAPVMPHAMAAKEGATDIIERQLRRPSASVSEETNFMANLHASSGDPALSLNLLEVAESPPVDLGTGDEVGAGFKIPTVLEQARNVQKDVANAVPKAMASQQLFDELREAAIDRVEKDDHDAFDGLKLQGMTHSYAAETKLQNHMSAEARSVEQQRITVSTNAAKGILPNGKRAHMGKSVHLVPVPTPQGYDQSAA